MGFQSFLFVWCHWRCAQGHRGEQSDDGEERARGLAAMGPAQRHAETGSFGLRVESCKLQTPTPICFSALLISLYVGSRLASGLRHCGVVGYEVRVGCMLPWKSAWCWPAIDGSGPSCWTALLWQDTNGEEEEEAGAEDLTQEQV